MALKRLIRDLIFVYIAFALISTGSLNLSIYGIIMVFFTFYFYLGPKN
ncbi:MAG: hypothetical protein JW791_02390 [Nanoarchaeota archaeon]|nr:hypothetical protein [Nanoarchaeota archaeon]